MKYLCMVYLDREAMDALPDSECIEFGEAMTRAGRGYLVSESLEPVETATTLRVRNGQVTLFDGPFAETKEQLAGFYLIEAADLNAAIAWASRIPSARVGSIEVRPVRTLGSEKGKS